MRRILFFAVVVALALLLPYSLKAQDRLPGAAPSMCTDAQANGVTGL